MTAVALDTLRISKRLREAGFSEPQAEAMNGVPHDAQETSLAELAPKAICAMFGRRSEICDPR